MFGQRLSSQRQSVRLLSRINISPRPCKEILCLTKYCAKPPIGGLFIFPVITPVVLRITIERRRIAGWSGGIFVPPFSGLLLFLFGCGFDFYKNNVHPYFFYIFQIDEQICLSPPKAPSARDDDSLNLTFRIGKYNVADSAQSFPVAKVNDFLLFEF